MRTIAPIVVTGLALLILAPAAVSGEEGPGQPLAVGDTAPAFEMAGSDGKSYQLKELAGERAVVLAWFPKAFTGG